MKTITLLALAFSLVIPPALYAQGGPPPWAGKGKGAATATSASMPAVDDEFLALDHFLAMSDAELDQLQQAIARVRAMTPAERAALREKMDAYRKLPLGQRAQIREGWGWQSPQDRDDWRTMMHGKTEAERAAMQAELQALPPEQRTARKLELLAAWRAVRARP